MSLQFQAELELLFDGASTGPTNRWTASNWIDKVLLATPSAVPIYYQPGLDRDPVWGKCRPIPGLPDQTGYDGVEVFAQHVLLWKGTQIKGSDLNDFANWIPVGQVASVGRATTAEAFPQPATGSASPRLFLDDVSGSFSVGQYVRVVSDEGDPSKIRHNYYTVDSVEASSTAVAAIDVSYGVPAATEGRIYLQGQVSWETGARLSIDRSATKLTVSAASRTGTFETYTLSGSSTVVPAPGGTIQLPLSGFPHDLRIGDIVSVGTANAYGQDLYEVVSVGQTLLAKRVGVGEAPQAAGTFFTVAPGSSPVYVRYQPYVQVQNLSDESVEVPDGARVAPADCVTLRNLGYSGAFSPGDTVPDGSVLETLRVSEATEIENVGDEINGDIFAIVTLADYAYILKRQSIQSIQYVGGTSPYAIRGEIFEEGPVGKYAWCRFDNKAIVFWGSKGWFQYSGGQVIEAAGAAHWDAVNAEMDRARADEIVAYHKPSASEVWFAYPVLGSADVKVAIYNYDSKSVVVDKYPATLNGIRALGTVEWEIAPTWESLPTTERCNSRSISIDGVVSGTLLPSKRWYEYADEGLQPRTLIGIGGDAGNPDNGESPLVDVPRILAHGRVWYRASSDDCDPQAYTACAETPDFDFGLPRNVKYVEGVYLHLHVPAKLERPMRLGVQIGARSSLDADIRWSAVRDIEVSGNGNVETKVDIRGAGRLIRVRFVSTQKGSRWAISQYRIVARIGGEY